MNDQVIGIFASDLHWSARPPLARSTEEDWLGVQDEAILVLRRQQAKYGCAIFLAGDVFNRWDEEPQGINRLISVMRGGIWYGTPGNHDLPNHSYAQCQRSAYWTLVEAGVLMDLRPGIIHPIGELAIEAFPCGFPIQPAGDVPKSWSTIALRVALVHDYVFMNKQTTYPGAKISQHTSKWRERLKDYDLAIFGDNHKGFYCPDKGKHPTNIINCGCLVPRRSDECIYKPSAWLVYLDGTVRRLALDNSQSVWADSTEEIARLEKALDLDLSGLTKELASARSQGHDWQGLLKHYCQLNQLTREVQEILIQVIEEIGLWEQTTRPRSTSSGSRPTSKS